MESLTREDPIGGLHEMVTNLQEWGELCGIRMVG